MFRTLPLAALALAALAGELQWRSWSRELTQEDPGRGSARPGASVDAAHRLAAAHPRPGRLGVLLLGYGNRGQRLNGVNRWRVEIALRTVRDEPDAVIVCSGGPTTGDGSEAGKLARRLRERGFTGEIRLEERSRSTVQNIRFGAPMLTDCARIAVVSQAPHALKARRILAEDHHDLARRLVRARDARPVEHPAIRLGFLVYGLKVL